MVGGCGERGRDLSQRLGRFLNDACAECTQTSMGKRSTTSFVVVWRRIEIAVD